MVGYYYVCVYSFLMGSSLAYSGFLGLDGGVLGVVFIRGLSVGRSTFVGGVALLYGYVRRFNYPYPRLYYPF